MITVMVPTRGRPEQVSRLMQSFIELTDNINDVQFVFGCDEDETELARKYGQTYYPKYDFKVTIDKVTNNKSLKVNRMYKATKGDILGVINDDMVCRTKGWDTIVKEQVKQYPDQIYLIYGRDGIQDKKLCTWQFSSRRVTELLHYIWYPHFTSFCMDDWNYDLFKRIGRLKYVPELYFEHMHWGQGKATYDKTYAKSPSDCVSDRTQYWELLDLRIRDAARLEKFIKEGK